MALRILLGCSVVLLLAPPLSAQLFLNTPSPAVIDAGGPTFTVTLTGFGFVSGSVARWRGSPLATTFVSSTQLTGSVPSSAIAISGIYEITVATPGGAVSNRGLVQVLPVLKAISPTEGPAGMNATLTAIGAGFGPDCVVRETTRGEPSRATVVNSTTLTAVVPPGILGPPGQRTPFNVGCPGGVSAATLTYEAKAPAIRVLSPSVVAASGPQFTLTVNGSSFAGGALLKWGSRVLQTTFVQDTQLRVEIPPELTASPGTYPVRIENPGGFASNAVSFIVETAPLVLRSVTPEYAVSNAPPSLLTVRGTGFSPDATIEWNGAPLSTTFISTTELIGGLTANMIAAPGMGDIRVRQASALSNGIPFPIRPMPVVAREGILNLGSGEPPIAPGALFSIYGYNLAVGEAVGSGPIAPTVLNGTSVRVNGIPAPLLYVSRNQINAQMPFEVAGPARLVISAGGLESAPELRFIYPTAPGVWRLPGTIQVLAVKPANAKLNSAEDPVKPREFVTIFLTGQGAVTNPVPTGAAAPENPLSLSVAPVLARIGGRAANVSFAGLAPGFIGLLQVNLQIPDIPPGDQPLEISVGGEAANLGQPLRIYVGSQ